MFPFGKDWSKMNDITLPVLRNSKRSIDFVLSYTNEAITNADSNTKINNFLSTLEERGLVVESEYGSSVTEMTFLKIYAPDNVLLNLATVYDIDLEHLNYNYEPDSKALLWFMNTPLTKIDPNHPDYSRAATTLSGERPSKFTTAERGLIIYKLMSDVWYGTTTSEFGVDKMVSTHIFNSAYVLHEGTWKWPMEGPITDRQLLAKYWGSLWMWYKKQPLNLIQRYFGPEVGFYFAWFGFYNKMLVPVSLLGLGFFLSGFYLTSAESTVEQVCRSKLVLCPTCKNYKACNFLPLSNSCSYAGLATFLDNYSSIVFAVLVSLWATLFIELWKQKQSIYCLRWNLTSVHVDRSIRTEYLDKATSSRISPVTGNVEPYVKLKDKMFVYGLTYVSIMLMMLILVAAVLSILVYRIRLKAVAYVTQNSFYKKNVSLIVSISSSLITIIFISIFGKIFRRMCLWLTKLECHRTQHGFDNAFIYKAFALAFVNNFSGLTYIGFFKGIFYTYPGDISVHNKYGGIKSDVCDPAGCLVDLSMQLFFILTFRNLRTNLLKAFFSFFNVQMKKLTKKKVEKQNATKYSWESDYFLLPTKKEMLVDEYLQLAIQYGLVTFFVAAFPLAPLFALLNNLIEIRLGAGRFVHIYQRTIAKRVTGIGAWNNILTLLTFCSITTNALVIAFTSDFVPRMIYKFTIRYDMHEYINSLYSLFRTADYYRIVPKSGFNTSYCYYRGKRYPPTHPNRYQLTTNFWNEIVIKFIFVFVFEHLIMLVKIVLSYSIDTFPWQVREKLNYEDRKLKESRITIMNQDYKQRTKK